MSIVVHMPDFYDSRMVHAFTLSPRVRRPVLYESEGGFKLSDHLICPITAKHLVLPICALACINTLRVVQKFISHNHSQL